MLIPESTYGSDEAGLVCAYLFAAGGAGRPLGSGEVVGWLRSADQRRGSFVWLNFSMSNAATEPWLRKHLALPEGFYDSLHASAGSTRVEQAEDALLAVVNDVLSEFTYDAAQVSTVVLCVQPDVVVSARIKPLRSIDQLRALVRAGQTFRSAAEVLARLLRTQADVLVLIVRESTARVDTVEDSLLADRVQSSRAHLGQSRRVLVRLQRLLAPEPAALFRLLNRPPEWIAEDDLRALRESAEEFSAAIADCAALVERVKLLQEELAALIAEQNNRSLFILTVVTVLALPINIIAGLFGMNVGGIPFAQSDGGFWAIVVVVASFTAIAGYFAFRRR